MYLNTLPQKGNFKVKLTKITLNSNLERQLGEAHVKGNSKR